MLPCATGVWSRSLGAGRMGLCHLKNGKGNQRGSRGLWRAKEGTLPFFCWPGKVPQTLQRRSPWCARPANHTARVPAAKSLSLPAPNQPAAAPVEVNSARILPLWKQQAVRQGPALPFPGCSPGRLGQLLQDSFDFSLFSNHCCLTLITRHRHPRSQVHSDWKHVEFK